jgi:RimJ/RimL family protein N-acetyltransferase
MTEAQRDFSIRTGVAADTAAYRELRLEALRNEPVAFSSDYETDRIMPEAHWTERLSASERGETEAIFLATHGSELLGMAGIVEGKSPKTRHLALIWGVYVRPAWRGRHIADALLLRCIEWAGQHASRRVRLAVSIANIPAIRAYRRLGFEVYGIEADAIHYQGQYVDELLMARRVE